MIKLYTLHDSHILLVKVTEVIGLSIPIPDQLFQKKSSHSLKAILGNRVLIDLWESAEQGRNHGMSYRISCRSVRDCAFLCFL